MDSNSTRGSTGQLSSAGSTGGGMHHSHSTPAGVDGGARTPPATPKKGGKMLAIRVQMLDDTITIFQVQAKAMGSVLFEQVCKQLHLLEADYFGLEYADGGGTKYWLDLQKPVSRQLGLSLVDPLLYFCVKFYTPDPGQLEEEYTRYLFCLQVKRDLSHGLMQCNENTAALMASYIVQAECGDYVAEDYPDHTYLSSYKFVPQQDQEMERKIMENHKKHSGQSPAEADLNLLETARRCELYGVKMHPAKDHENVPLNLAVAHMGIIVFQNYTKINTFSWAKIRKISFKRKRFLIKLHPEGYGYYKDTVEFFFEGRNECKNFWKKCVENHGFFRCSSVKNVARHKTRVLSRGSSFRYSGKTQKQIVEFVRDNYVKRQTFQRSASFRHSSAHSSATNMHSSTVGNSISAHPLLPLADSNLSVEACKLSTSLGSMGAAVAAPGSPTTRSAYLPRATATSWSSAPDTRPTTLPAQTTTSPSPPLTTQSASPATSATTSPLHTPYTDQKPPFASSPVAVRAAVHRADTGTITPRIPTTSTRTPSSHKSEGSLPLSPPFANITNACPSQTQSHNDLGRQTVKTQAPVVVSPPKRHVWQRSSSCRDLYDFSFEDSGQAKRRSGKLVKAAEKAVSADNRKLESPITRYDDHPIYNASSRDSSLEIHQDIMMPDQKVYSSSYPGTTSYSQESVEDPGNYDLRDSQEDLSHDSYELIEKSDDDYSEYTHARYKKHKPLNTRSCSLDSNNYLPSDSDSDGDKKKCKSSSDVHIFMMDDPRDLPREIIPRKSDGSFYKNYKTCSRTSSQESKSDYYESATVSLRKSRSYGSRTSSPHSHSESGDNYEHHRKRRKKNDSRTSSLESKSEYYDASSKTVDEPKRHDYDRKISFERNYGVQKIKQKEETTHVHSISLQNVETEQSLRVGRLLADLEQQNTVPRTHKASLINNNKTTHIWPESIQGVPTEIKANNWKTSKRSTESESNIFSFDEDKIQSLQDDIFDSTKPKQVFIEIEPRKIREPLPLHQPIERTKSDPNSLARQRINSNTRRMLMHQKSIDLTPAESSDDDYLYKQIPSAPPIMKYNRNSTYFEMPTAEFGHFDILKREIEGQKTKFEVPKSQFAVFGAKGQSDFINLPPKNDDIPYVLHKRHIMNGTAAKDEATVPDKPEEITNTNPPPIRKLADEIKLKTNKLNSKPPPPAEAPESFLFTQNIDLSKVDPVTLEIDKSEKPIQHLSSPKRERDITHIDPLLMEALSSKLSQIESDSPTSSKTESLKPQIKILAQIPEVAKVKEIDKLKPAVVKPRRIIKPRMQPGKKGKGNRTKVRITSFSSDDESLDSDDVFGSAEATPTRVEFSPPQMRKEMESILKFESERKYLQYTMSSTEVEGSPPQTRKKAKDNGQYDAGLDPNSQHPELRRISERSFSIPSSEDDLNIKASDLQPVFAEPDTQLTTLQENDKEQDKSLNDDDNKTEINLDEEREKEKLLLQAEIENDLKDLKVPARTKITEITSPGVRRKGQSSLLFAHARLNLSEGSAFTLLQKQQATESPLSSRRAKSLDTPIIPVNRLPPLNAFSSKDDTVEEEHKSDSDNDVEDKTLVQDTIVEVKPEVSKVNNKKIKERDQIVPEVKSKSKAGRVGAQPKLVRGKPVPTQRTTSLRDSNKCKEKPPKTSTRPPKPVPKSAPVSTKPPKVVSSKVTLEPETVQEDQKKSLEKLELKRVSSKERTKSQDDSDTDISKRREKQQMLYETAIKQTKTIKSPVKDALPVFPQVEEMVRERHGKLEISINTIDTNVSLEEAIIITKSPKKLDKKMDKKLTKSLELDLTADDQEDKPTIERLGKSLDLDNRPKESDVDKTEFDFKPETVEKYESEISPDAGNVIEIVEAEVHKESTEEPHHEVTLEGTSLDVWLSLDNNQDKLGNITLIQKSSDNDFFEERPFSSRPPDLIKIDAKSSSDSQSIERVSLGNSLDIKYIDDSGDSSHKSEQDTQLIAEMQKASDTVSKFLKKKLEKRRLGKNDVPVRITSEDDFTEVKRPEIDTNLLNANDHRDALLKLSIERSRSEDTGSWVTVECDEFYGAESLDYDQTPDTAENKPNLLSAAVKHSKLDLLKRSSDQSRSSDTTGSWTSGEKDPSPSNVNDDSSVSYGRAIGFSQTIEKFACKEQIGSPDTEPPRSPRSPRICVLGRAFTIDEDTGGCPIKYDDSSSGDDSHIPKDLTPIQENLSEPDSNGVRYKKTPYPFEEKWSNDSELSQRLHKKLTKKHSSADDSSNRASLNLSVESRNSVDTESSSGSLGVATRLTKSSDIPKELSSTWKPFPLDSSGSESFDDGLLPPDELDKQEYFLRRDNSGDFANLSDVCYKSEEVTPTRDDTELPEDLANFTANFGYPCITALTGEVISVGFLSRTLSRISERSTNSEKSSLEEDSTKASTQSDSLNDESNASSNPQVSLSSDPPSHAHVSEHEHEKRTPTNEKPSLASLVDDKNYPQMHMSSLLLQRQISDDRRTSAEMAELSMDDIEIITSDRGLKLKRQGSDDTIIDEECFINQSSQDSEDYWPLPEIPQTDKKTLLALHEIPSSDTSQQTTQVFQPPKATIPKVFGLRGSLKSQDSEQWPSPPSSVVEPPIVGDVKTFYVTPPEEACQVTLDSSTVSTYDNDSNSDDNKTSEDADKTHTYENVATEFISESISESLSVGASGVKIVLDNTKSKSKSVGSGGSNSDEDLNLSNLNDDVFTDAVDARNELRPPTVMRRSTTSDDSSHSHSGNLKVSPQESRHSGSYSEEDCTSTNLDDGTVRYAFKPTKCTHSSHSEDTSIALSLSEWSNSTNTVKFQNLSSNSGTKSSSGLKSDDNSLTDIAQSISEWSSSNTNSTTLKAQQGSLQFQKLSSNTTSTTGDSTLTEFQAISEWSTSSESKNLIPQHIYGSQGQIQMTRLGSSVDDCDLLDKSLPSPKNIPSEDLAQLSLTSLDSDVFYCTKSTERPIVIPVLSDTEKSSSSVEQSTVHTQRYLQKYQQLTKSTERPVKVPLKLSKCSPYYSSSLSSESTPLASTSPIPISKTATVPLTRTHRKPVAKSLFQAKSPPSEDSTSSVESPKSKSERDRRGYRRRRQSQNQKRHKPDRFENIRILVTDERYENLEEGYQPDDGDSQSGSDIFRMENEDDRFDSVEGFDVSSIPPPLLEDDFEEDSPQI